MHKHRRINSRQYHCVSRMYRILYEIVLEKLYNLATKKEKRSNSNFKYLKPTIFSINKTDRSIILSTPLIGLSESKFRYTIVTKGVDVRQDRVRRSTSVYRFSLSSSLWKFLCESIAFERRKREEGKKTENSGQEMGEGRQLVSSGTRHIGLDGSVGRVCASTYSYLYSSRIQRSSGSRAGTASSKTDGLGSKVVYLA